MRNPDRQTTFHFKRFSVSNCRSAMKVGTDGVLLGAWAFEDVEPGPMRMLDVGCGTGVISLMLAQRFPDAIVVGVDIDKDAVDEAASNFASSPWPGRLTAVQCDFLRFNDADGFDLIACNPPFFTDGALAPDAARRKARHQDGLTFTALMRGASRLLRPGGRVAVVAPAEAESELMAEACICSLKPSRLTAVRTVEQKKPRRILLECVKDDKSVACSKSTLLISEPDGTPGQEYSRLVSPFYLKF